MAHSLALLAETAADLRRRASLSEPSFSTKLIIEACFPDVVVTGRVLPIGIQEIVARTDEGPIIIYSRHLPVAKQRYVIAHALAHLIFDGAEGQCGPGYAGDPVREGRADRFAEELLVPLVELRPYIACWPRNENTPEHEIYLDQCDEIASRFNVPPFVIDRRIREVMSPSIIR